jgi:6-phosphogluconolactonase
MGAMPRTGIALRATAIFFAACLFMAVGCGSGKFFVPTCQQTNSCGGGSGTNSSYAYVANATLGTLAAFPLPTKPFTSLTGKTYTLGTPPSAIAATPKGTFLYVATVAGPVFVYSIASDGTLTLGNSGAAVVTALLPTWISVDPSGTWLFIVSSSSPQLLEFQINTTTGTLTQVGQGTTLNSGSPTQVYVTPNGQNLYVGLGLGGLDAFSFASSSGALSNHLHYAAKGVSADNAIAADTKSAFLFVGEAGSGIRVFSIGTAAALTEISGSPFQSQLGPASIVVDPTNSHVYVANRTDSVITGYTLATTGALTALSSSPFQTGTGPSAMSLDSTGKYLLVTCVGGSPDLQVFSFDASDPGKLDSVATTATGTGAAGAISLSVVP